MDAVNRTPGEADTSMRMGEDQDRLKTLTTMDDMSATIQRAASHYSAMRDAERFRQAIASVLSENRARLQEKAQAPATPRAPGFLLESAWEGVVQDVEDETFTARVTPIGSGQTEYVVTLPLDDLDDADRGRVRPGSLFYWNVGRDLSTRPRRRVSEIWIRRIDMSSVPEADSSAIESFKALFSDD